ncbi:hypothetical protein [Archangium sp.]|jgi:hypothetical protein|uniref:hypothetical protein n=1 Tax=Archangium sp. TaxID=1872627 RepID=UPI002ED9B170
MRKVLSTLLVALLCACEPEKPSSPSELRILSIAPTQQSAAEAKTVTVELDLDPRFLVDYSAQTARLLDQPTLQVGSQTVPLERYLGEGRFEGTVPPGLGVGTHDIRVSLPDGREATLAQAWRVRPSVGFWVESIGPQIQDRPFIVTIHASGTDAEQFEGTVTLSILWLQGNAPSTRFQSGPFANGVRRQELEINTPGNILLRLEDEEGRETYSNAFRVDPKH